MRTCRTCGKQGHDGRNCPERPKGELDKYIEERDKREPGFAKLVEEETKKLEKQIEKKKQRTCKKCGGIGHDSRNCTSDFVKEDEEIPIGHQILQQQKEKVDRIPINNIVPQKGMWIVNVEKQRVAGRISYVKRTGEIVWEDCYMTLIESDPKVFVENGYEYACTIDPIMLRWSVVGLADRIRTTEGDE